MIKITVEKLAEPYEWQTDCDGGTIRYRAEIKRSEDKFPASNRLMETESELEGWVNGVITGLRLASNDPNKEPEYEMVQIGFPPVEDMDGSYYVEPDPKEDFHSDG